MALFAPLGPRFAAEVWISTAEELYCRVYVNPYSGVVQGKMTS